MIIPNISLSPEVTADGGDLVNRCEGLFNEPYHKTSHGPPFTHPVKRSMTSGRYIETFSFFLSSK